MSQSWIDDQCPSVIICVDIELILIYSLDCDIRMLIYVCFICFVIACVVLRVYKSVVCIGVMLGLGTLAVKKFFEGPKQNSFEIYYEKKREKTIKQKKMPSPS